MESLCIIKACRACLISEEKNVTFPRVTTLFLKMHQDDRILRFLLIFFKYIKNST